MSSLDLSDAQEYLNTAAADADKLQAVIDAAEATIAMRVGPLEPTTITRRVLVDCELILPVLPVISLTSLTYVISGGTVSAADLYVDPVTGVVSFATSIRALTPGWCTVVYQAGRTTLPDDLMLAVKELVRHMWTTQRGSGVGRPGAASPETLSNTLPGSAYALPMRVEQLLVPHAQVDLV